MPELPEVEITKRKLRPLLGKTIVDFWSDWPRALRLATLSRISQDITGRRIVRIWRRGKAVFLGLGEEDNSSPKKVERVLGFHQRMSGRLMIKTEKPTYAPPTSASWRTTADRQDFEEQAEKQKKHVHVRVIFKDGVELLFQDPRKFGVVWYGSPEEVLKDKYIASLGPDALTVSFPQFQKRITKRAGMIKPVLLRQDVVAGIGNIVADEMLWEAEVHPKIHISELGENEMHSLFRALQTILARSIKAQGTTMRDWAHPDGSKGRFQDYMRVYGKKEARCSRCKNKIERIVVGSRGTWICSFCQRVS